MIRDRSPLRTALCLAALGLALAASPATAADFFIPEDNSAVNQYTEGIPTGGGQKEADEPSEAAPAETLGQKNARKLEGKGREGEVAAVVAAETAAPDLAVETGDREDSGGGSGGSGGGAGGGGGKAGGAGGGGAEPAGDSGVGQLVATATGTSGGGIGLLLPLAIAATLVWGLAYLLRNRGGTGAPAGQS